VEVVKPVVGSTEKGFAAHVGQFDALVDTVGNERSVGLTYDESNSNYNYDDDDVGGGGGSVLQLLKTRHNCYKYISTMTHSQDLIAKEGIFGGPGMADKYSQDVGSISFQSNSRECRAFQPPSGIGKTLEILFQKGVVFTDKQRKKLCSKKSDAVRGWTLADFWEQTSWPRDSSGTGSLRFGLPAREELLEEMDTEFMVSESPFRQQLMSTDAGDVDDGYDLIGGSDRSSSSQAIQDNPFVLNVVGVNGVDREIVKAEKDCIMFLSARFCKTCKQINPVYTRMARINQEKSSTNLSFVKAEASGSLGKELGQHLSVRAVPAFVFYRKGKIFGIPLSVSRLPSRKIDRALELLTSGAEWDDSILDES
jgi:thiol-disulfide isomerase/thioredoxin